MSVLALRQLLTCGIALYHYRKEIVRLETDHGGAVLVDNFHNILPIRDVSGLTELTAVLSTITFLYTTYIYSCLLNAIIHVLHSFTLILMSKLFLLHVHRLNVPQGHIPLRCRITEWIIGVPLHKDLMISSRAALLFCMHAFLSQIHELHYIVPVIFQSFMLVSTFALLVQRVHYTLDIFLAGLLSYAISCTH